MLELLTGPIISVLAVLGLAIVTDPQSVFIGAISVPNALSEAGYTEQVVENRLVEELLNIEADAHSRAEARRLASDAEPSPPALLAKSFEALEFVRSVQESAGLIAISLSGEIVSKGDRLEMVLRGKDTEKHAISIQIDAPAGDIDGLIHTAALETLEVIAPYVRAAWQFKEDIEGRDFSRTIALLDAMHEEETNRRSLWLINLRGMVLAVQQDFTGALATFRRVSDLEPSFTPSMLNQGVILAHLGRHEEAIARFRKALEYEDPEDAPSVHAATYAEWGQSLAALGFVDDALKTFAYAAKVDPRFGETYVHWADVLTAAGRADEAEEKRAMAKRHSGRSQIYAEILAGLIKDEIKRPGM